MGLRREEIFGLQTKNVDLKNKTIYINRAAVYIAGEGVKEVPTKTKTSTRKLTMPDVVYDLIKEYLKEQKSKTTVSIEQWLFYSQNKITQPDAFNNMLKRACTKLKIKRITPHTLRHMYGSNLINQGIDIAVTSQQLGHTKKSFTVDTYIHAIDKDDHKAATASQEAFKSLLKNKTQNKTQK